MKTILIIVIVLIVISFVRSLQDKVSDPYFSISAIAIILVAAYIVNKYIR